uniref:Uncharacterized protein n=1 Tax=viral metagenome TaxID=1070528 RepID=A0A6C0CA15_9ZZZZ
MSSENKTVDVPVDFAEIISKMAIAIDNRNQEIRHEDSLDAEESLSSDVDENVLDDKKEAIGGEETPTPQEEVPEKKARGLPRSIMLNQAKYTEALEKQQRMMNGAKKKKNPPTKNAKSAAPSTTESTISQDGSVPMQRMIIGGKVKYIPIKTTSAPEPQTIAAETTADEIPEPIPKKVPSKIADNMEKYNKQMEDQGKPVETKKNTAKVSSKIPSRYVGQIEKEIKQSTTKNVKSFTELRKIRMMDDLKIDTDVNKTSMVELRKLKMEQRKNELLAAKKITETNKKESAVKNILSDDKMTKFSKTVAIKNLSVGSRNNKNNRVSRANVEMSA